MLTVKMTQGIENAWNQIGNYYADRLKWEKAAEYVNLMCS